MQADFVNQIVTVYDLTELDNIDIFSYSSLSQLYKSIEKNRVNHMCENNEPEWMQQMKLTEEIRRFASLYIQKAAKGSPYSAQEIDALFRLEIENGLLTPLALSRKMGINKAIVSRLIERLHNKGVIEKVFSNNDKRSYCLKLTQKGRDTLSSAYLYYIAPLKTLEDKLGADQFHLLFQLISLANES